MKAAEVTGIPVDQLELTTAEGEVCTDDQAISDISTLQLFVVKKYDGWKEIVYSYAFESPLEYKI